MELLKTKQRLATIATEYRRQMLAFGIVLFINYPLYYLIWVHSFATGYENLALRLIASALCLPLIFNQYWPKKARHWLTLYWYAVACYGLPFFFTFMLLQNNASTLWLMNSISAVFFVLLLFDAITSLLLIFIGSLAAFITFVFFSSGVLIHYPGPITTASIFATFTAAIIIGSIFSRNKQLVEEVNRRSIKAEANSKAKSEFIANMSHDIRTPITGIIGLAQNMIKQANNNNPSLANTVKEDANLLIGSTNQLLKLCNEILELVELESGRVNAKAESFNIRELVQHNIELLQPSAKAKGLTLQQSIDNNVPSYLNGYRIYLDRILLNLISNAIKFTESGFVQLHIESKDSPSNNQVKLLIKVTDSGIGIPPQNFDTIFEHFSRLSPAYQGKYKGTGLGLYTVKQYVEAMQGSITVSSEVDKGSTFIAVIPFGVSDEKIAKTDNPADIDIPSSAVSLKKILIVEDDALAAKALKLNLENFNCDIQHANTGAIAVERANTEEFDLILMDIGLPDFSGIEATKRIRDLKTSVPIIALTGHANNPKMRQEALDAGMQDVLSKPATVNQLKSVFTKYFDGDFNCNTEPQPSTNNAVIDWPGCVAMCHGKEELAKELLDILYNDLIKTRPKLEEYFRDNDIDSLRSELHRLSGSVSYMKLPQLADAIHDYHRHIDTDDNDKLGNEMRFRNLIEAIDNFISSHNQA